MQPAELQRLVDHLRLQMSELLEQRDVELRRAGRNEESRQQLDAKLHEALETAKSEREDWAEYVRSVENRALSDVDRARQEAKELQAQLNSMPEHHRAIDRQLRLDLHAAQAVVARASQAEDIVRGRSDALEQQLSSLRDLPAQLDSAFKRSQEVKSIAKRNRRKRPSGVAFAGHMKFRIMYIMFTAGSPPKRPEPSQPSDPKASPWATLPTQSPQR